jgi:DNA primase
MQEHGTLAPPALFAEMLSPSAPEGFAALAQRVRQFHDLSVGDEARHEIGVVIDRLRLDAVQNELELLAGTEGLSETARTRQRGLLDRQRQLKASLARPMIEGR